MTRRMKRAAKWLCLALAVMLVIGVIAPYLSGNQFAPRIRKALESGLGRRVEFGAVHFSLFRGPGLSIENVIIHESPALGIEPIAYVGSLEAVPRLSSIFGGRLEFSSIRLEDATINVAKTGGPAEPGRWNFEALLNRSVMRTIPELHVRSGRINFKFGDTKSVFYLTNTDLDIQPPSRGGSPWTVECTGQPARTDKPARGFGNFLAGGRWSPDGAGRLNLDVRLEKSEMSEIIELLHGYDAGIHGSVSARLHLDGPLSDIRISGSVSVADVHRWDQMPPYGQSWPLRLAGRLNVTQQTLELESSTAGGQTLPLAVRFRCANYLSQPRWGVALNWNRFPAGPVLDLARHMGADLPPGMQMTGSMDGVIGYSGQGSLQGALDFHDASIAMPGSPPLRSAQAHVVFDRGHARLTDVIVRTVQEETAQLDADYDWTAPSLDLTIATDAMRVESLRVQVALAKIPWLDQAVSGTWKGQLHYQVTPQIPAPKAGWSGIITLHDAKFSIDGLSDPILMQSATAHIDGPRVVVEHIVGQAGKIAIAGEYRYEPQMSRPYRLRLRIPAADAAEVERVMMPSLHHNRGLIARALSLGRPSLPDWLEARRVDATVQIGSFQLGDVEARDVQGHFTWDAAKAEVADIQAKVDGGRLTGELAVGLRGSRPTYRLQAHWKGIQWKSGTVDADTAMESSGTGDDLLTRLHATGAFSARGVEIEALPDLETVSGNGDLLWTRGSPILRFTELQLVSGDETYTGQGDTQPDGRLVIQLSNGSKQMRMSGTLAELRMEQAAAR